MGKKDKDKHRKKGKHEAPFVVPRPPPRPLPAAAARSSTDPAPSAEATIVEDGVALALDLAASARPALDAGHLGPGAPIPDRAFAGEELDEESDDLVADDEPAAGGDEPDADDEDVAESDDLAADENDVEGDDLVAAAGVPAPEESSPGGRGEQEDEPLDDAAPDSETIDVADIADIAPVAPAGALDDVIASSSQRPRALDGEDHPPTVEELTQQIRELEARLDRMLDERRSASSPSPRSWGTGPARAPDLEWSDAPPPAGQQAPDLPASEFRARQWGREGLRQRSEEVDELGFDAAYEERWRPFIDFLYRYYFRVNTEGIEHIPAEGRCVIVANHAGGPLPYDGLMLRAAIRRAQSARRDLRWLAEDFVFYLPFVGVSLNRLGAVRACQENAERLLSREGLVAVFPEGAKGIGKPFEERYRLQRFGRGGFVRLCLRTGTPIVPCAIVGAEEANPTVYRLESLAQLVGLPYLPVTPTFPAFGPLGLLPAPSKWKIRFGAPIRLTTYGPGSADDDLLVSRLADGVRTVIQEMLSDMLTSRRSVWFG